MGAAALWVAISVAGEIAVTDIFQIRTYAEELYTEMAIGPALHEAPLRALPGIAVTAWGALAGIILIARFRRATGTCQAGHPGLFNSAPGDGLWRFYWCCRPCCWSVCR